MSTLAAIRKLPTADRSRFIARIVDSISLDPAYEVRPTPEPAISAAQSELLKAIHESTFESNESRIKAFKYLANALRENTVPPKLVADIRKRLGNKGALALDRYSVEFGQNFTDLNQTLGVSRNEVTNGIDKADAVQHFLPEGFGNVGGKAATIIVRHVVSSDPYSLLVLAYREGASMYIDGAWKSYWSDVATEPLSLPIDFLAAFVNVFGLDIRLDGKIARFVHDKVFYVPFQQSFQIQVVDPAPMHDLRMSTAANGLKHSVALAFAIDVRKYAASLSSHGVKTTRDTHGGSHGVKVYSHIFAPERRRDG